MRQVSFLFYLHQSMVKFMGSLFQRGFLSFFFSFMCFMLQVLCLLMHALTVLDIHSFSNYQGLYCSELNELLQNSYVTSFHQDNFEVLNTRPLMMIFQYSITAEITSPFPCTLIFLVFKCLRFKLSSDFYLHLINSRRN